MSRRDLVQPFARLDGAADLTFVEYEREWGDGVDRSVYAGIGKLVTWEESRSSDSLLRTVKPDRVVLLFNSSLAQVALRVAARDRGIETVHVEHGYRLPAEDAPTARADAHLPQGRRLGTKRTDLFFARSLPCRRPRRAAALSRYAVALARNGATPKVLWDFAALRRPDRYISYSRECFRYHQDVDRPPEAISKSTIFTGIPQLDDFRIVNGDTADGEVLLIDHQFHNSGLCGWDESFRGQWVRSLAETVFVAGARRLYIRLHPGDRSHAWDALMPKLPIQIVDRDELPGLSRRVATVLGTFSTMQLPFAALPHIAMISLEIHPQPGWFPSRRLAEAGVTAPVHSYEDLAEGLRRIHELRARQFDKKPEFVAQFLERLDGGASERLAASLLP